MVYHVPGYLYLKRDSTIMRTSRTIPGDMPFPLRTLQSLRIARDPPRAIAIREQSSRARATRAFGIENGSTDQTLYTPHMALKRMDNVGIVVEDLEETIDFFRELGLKLEGRATIEGEWAGCVTGMGDQRVEIAMMRTPDGHGRK